MAYFERTGESTFRPTQHVSGAWNTAEQHIAPALGLLAHVVESDRDARRGDGLVIGRLSYDIFGKVPVEEVRTEVRVIRPGRTVEL
ncbi:MAG TPA: acyl-CoA thioesterase domain-containing protein, partial [Jatrophihabitans sp.]